MKMNKRQLQSIETKNRILDAVHKLLLHSDLDRIKIRDICKEAGISLGSFYVYFSSKEEAILYIYRNCDENFSELELSASVEDNIRLILLTYFRMVDLENVNFNRQIYICHLTHFDEYFFREDRPLFIILSEQISLLGGSVDVREITWNILDFMRGCIYNLCIRFEDDTAGWLEHSVDRTYEYLHFLIGK